MLVAPSSKNKLAWPLVPNFADVDNAELIRIAAGVLEVLPVDREVNPAVPQAPGGPLEQAVCDHLGVELARRHQDRQWLVGRGTMITGFDQYAHLSDVDALVRANPELRITVGMDYLIRPDVTVGLGHVET
ncbi:MAG TPA: NgoMIV family type II restriction endonuclease, partial [Streptosporangiaceae bacterium]|nr:NgoMIV family type II restriction endonuclease [Streptosporangiaceae bacterium]